MTDTGRGPFITELDGRVASLPPEDRAQFERIFHLSTTCGEILPPDTMHDWLVHHFGTLDAVRHQRIVKITNRVTMEGALFNALRAQRPLQAPAASDVVKAQLEQSDDCEFCHPQECTPADLFGRIRGQHSITASNVAKYDGWHTVIVFDEHHPLHFTAAQVADYVNTAQRWAQRAHQADPASCYPFFLWNCLWRSGASILHGHAQMVLTRDMHYTRVEQWRQAALRYSQTYGVNYFADLIAAQRALGLAIDLGSATILPSLTPFKEKETHIIGHDLNGGLTSALYRVLKILVQQLDVQSFNLALYQPPLCHTPESWEGFPYVFRILDRGKLNNNTSDVGSMEFFAQSVIATDPFRLVEALRMGLQEELT